MDIKLFIAVIKRFKKQVLGGFVLAILLSILSYGTPGLRGGKPTVIPRGTETWQSQAELLITQASDPYGRAVEQYTGGKGGAPAVPVGDQGYMSNLAPIYAGLANGTAVQAMLRKAEPGADPVVATPVINQATDIQLPFIQLTATATSATAAVNLSTTASSILINYVARQQTLAGIAPADRVVLEVVQNGGAPQMTSGPSTSVPLLVFVAVLGAAIALAFMRENANPRTAAALGRVAAPGWSERENPREANGHRAHANGLRVARAEPGGRPDRDLGLPPRDRAMRAPDDKSGQPLSATNPAESNRVLDLLIRDRARPRKAEPEG